MINLVYYIPKYFKIQELVDPETFAALGTRCWILFRPELLWTIDEIRVFFDRPVLINNWIFGGTLKYRGFRPSSCKVGAKFSQHKFGCAVDFDVRDMTANEVRKKIMDNYKTSKAFQHITAMERNVTWVHIDLRNIEPPKDGSGITFFDP